MATVTEQPIKKIDFFRCPQSLPSVAPLTKKPEDSGYEIAVRAMRVTRATVQMLRIFICFIYIRVRKFWMNFFLRFFFFVFVIILERTLPIQNRPRCAKK